MKLVLTVEETAKVLGIGRAAAYEAVRKNVIPSVAIGRRRVVPIACVERILHVEPGTLLQVFNDPRSAAA